MLNIYNNKYIVLLCFVAFFLSINNPIQKDNFLNISSFITLVNFVRMLGPIFVLFFIIFFFLNIKILKKIILNTNVILAALFFLIQIISYFAYNKTNINFIYYPAASLIFLLFLTVFNSKKNFGTLDYAMSILIVLLMINCSIVIFYVVKELYFDMSLNSFSYSYYNSLTLDPSSRFFDNASPRSTGIARQLLLINIFYFFYSHIIKNIGYKLFAFFLIFSSSYFIFAFQSRTSVYFLLIFYIFFLFLLNKYDLKIKILYFIIFLLLPFTLSNYEKSIKNEIIVNNPYFKQYEFLKSPDQSLKSPDQSLKSLDHLAVKNKEYAHMSNRILAKSTSGRMELWKKAIKFFEQRPFLGYGPQADRYLLNENVSNVFLYTLLCGGILGFSVLFILILNLIFIIYRLIFNYKVFKYKSPTTVKVSIIFLIYLLLRGLVENTFSVYSIDFIVFSISYTILNNYIFLMKK